MIFFEYTLLIEPFSKDYARHFEICNFMKILIKLWDLGCTSYIKGLEMQHHARSLLENNHLCANKLNDFVGIVILLEHINPTYTIGLRKYETKNHGKSNAGLIINKKQLTALGADYFETNRGGLITYHGPGQLVAYPIINLNKYVSLSQSNANLGNKLKNALDYPNTRINSIKWYVQQLADIMTHSAQSFGINNVYSLVVPSALTGSWVIPNGSPELYTLNLMPNAYINNFLAKSPQKLGAIGISYSRDITGHGLALNCNVDLAWYDHIDPCGLLSLKPTDESNHLKNCQNIKMVTSISEILKEHVPVSMVKPHFLETFEQTFNCKLEICSDYKKFTT